MWLEGPAHVSAETQKVTVEADDWSYGFSGPLPWWDREGTLRDDGWPDCLTDRTTRVRFLALPREVDDLGTRPVLAVDCR